MTLIALLESLGIDSSRGCPVCTQKFKEHDDGDLLWCFGLYTAAGVTRAGVQRQLNRRIARTRRGKR